MSKTTSKIIINLGTSTKQLSPSAIDTNYGFAIIWDLICSKQYGHFMLIGLNCFTITFNHR